MPEKTAPNGNGTITITKGKLVIGSGVVIAVLIAITNLVPVRGNQQSQAPDSNDREMRKIEARVTEVEASHRETVARNNEQFKHIDEKLGELLTLIKGGNVRIADCHSHKHGSRYPRHLYRLPERETARM